MNKSIMMGRLVRDPEVRYSATSNGELAIATFRLAVDRKFSREGDPTADFFRCTAFGRKAEFVADYLRQGIKVVVEGRMQNDNYTNRDGERVYGVCLMVDDLDFAESKKAYEERQGQEMPDEDRLGRRTARSNRSERAETSERKRRESNARRSEREDSYMDEQRETARRTQQRSERSSARETSGARSTGNRSTERADYERRSQDRSRDVNDRFMEAPDEELDFD